MLGWVGYGYHSSGLSVFSCPILAVAVATVVVVMAVVMAVAVAVAAVVVGIRAI